MGCKTSYSNSICDMPWWGSVLWVGAWQGLAERLACKRLRLSKGLYCEGACAEAL